MYPLPQKSKKETPVLISVVGIALAMYRSLKSLAEFIPTGRFFTFIHISAELEAPLLLSSKLKLSYFSSKLILYSLAPSNIASAVSASPISVFSRLAPLKSVLLRLAPLS